MKDFKKEIVSLLKRQVKGLEVEELIEVPPNHELGDYAFPCFALSKILRKNPADIAKELEKKIRPTRFIEKITATGPYLNFYINKTKKSEMTLKEVAKRRAKYGSSKSGKGKTVVIDYSSPNIAKPFSIAHLRSTMIGNSLYKIYSFLGYKCVGINHLGDWGTQFGKLIVAYKRWGSKEELEKSPIKHLLRLYVKYHEEAEKDPKRDEEAREWFKKLELGDKEANVLWQKFSKHSLEEFKRLYKRLNVKFDDYIGESAYNPLIEPFISNLQNKGIPTVSEGALVVKLDDFNMPPCILRKSDGATTYETRDLVAAEYRHNKYKFDKMLYVVDSRQSLHLQQVFKVLELAGREWVQNCFHVNFGVMKLPEGVMSTRKGKVIFLEEVIDKTKGKVMEIIKEKNPTLKNKEEVAEKVAIGAIIFWDLSHDRARDINFEWEKVLDFEGETGPYVQYAYTRASSILIKAKQQDLVPGFDVKFSVLNKPEEERLVVLLSQFEGVIKNSAEHNKPSIVAKFVFELAQAFNEFYQKCQCLSERDKELTKARLFLVYCVKLTLDNGLNLLGIPITESM